SGIAFGAAASSHEAIKVMRQGSRKDTHEAGKRAFVLSRGKTVIMPTMVIHGDDDEIVDPVNAEQIASQFDFMNKLLGQDTDSA
ncbi:MAG: hypothetical protein GTO41_02580, partial [Burkholderiales bacterium]|nr:hypothetical protein [Burkholderiales bacterium]